MARAKEGFPNSDVGCEVLKYLLNKIGFPYHGRKNLGTPSNGHSNLKNFNW